MNSRVSPAPNNECPHRAFPSFITLRSPGRREIHNNPSVYPRAFANSLHSLLEFVRRLQRKGPWRITPAFVPRIQGWGKKPEFATEDRSGWSSLLLPTCCFSEAAHLMRRILGMRGQEARQSAFPSEAFCQHSNFHSTVTPHKNKRAKKNVPFISFCVLSGELGTCPPLS